ncbi:MAG: nitrate reductase molybdenum cofactor assembly chaperone [Geobacteraceae bacterium]|nr:nitrate reductase molybdenum cofactor assembly chaperone [Geobacteraceae bacterium]NTW79263.1 nitrate reductase molybdenum cofactor assembly chaperone [Geobacteraceae bacterium]
MTIAASYEALARLLDYPENKEQLQADYVVVSTFLNQQRLDSSIASFAEFAADSPLSSLQEEYVASFDFNPATAPYLGHHLFGDNQKKGGYMIMLKQEFERCGYTPTGVELPDHLSVLLGFLAHLARQAESGARQSFITECVLPGVERFHDSFDTRQESHWKVLVEASWLLCAEDCKEVHSC